MTGHLLSANSEGWWARLGRNLTPQELSQQGAWPPLQYSCTGGFGAQSVILNVPNSLIVGCIKSPLISNLL